MENPVVEPQAALPLDGDAENNGAPDVAIQRREMFPCSLCRASEPYWSTHESLVAHRKRHRNRNKTFCSRCGKKFKTDDLFDNHSCKSTLD